MSAEKKNKKTKEYSFSKSYSKSTVPCKHLDVYTGAITPDALAGILSKRLNASIIDNTTCMAWICLDHLLTAPEILADTAIADLTSRFLSTLYTLLRTEAKEKMVKEKKGDEGEDEEALPMPTQPELYDDVLKELRHMPILQRRFFIREVKDGKTYLCPTFYTCKRTDGLEKIPLELFVDGKHVVEELECKPSKIHGTGTFAKKALAVNTIIKTPVKGVIRYQWDLNRYCDRLSKLEAIFCTRFNMQIPSMPFLEICPTTMDGTWLEPHPLPFTSKINEVCANVQTVSDMSDRHRNKPKTHRESWGMRR